MSNAQDSPHYIEWFPTVLTCNVSVFLNISWSSNETGAPDKRLRSNAHNDVRNARKLRWGNRSSNNACCSGRNGGRGGRGGGIGVADRQQSVGKSNVPNFWGGKRRISPPYFPPFSHLLGARGGERGNCGGGGGRDCGKGEERGEEEVRMSEKAHLPE